MAKAFEQFKNQIPTEVYDKTETRDSTYITISRPTAYLVDTDINLQHYHFTLLTNASPPMKVGKREYQFSRKRMLVFTPDTIVRCTMDAPSGEYIAMTISKDFFLDVAREALGNKNPAFSNIDNPYSLNLVRLIRTFEEELDNARRSSHLMLQSISAQIAIQILRESGLDNPFDRKRILVDRNYVSLAKDFMMTYYNANIKLEDICRQIHLSPHYFIRMFKEATGQSPHEFLIDFRVSKAEEMLKKGNYSIEEIARFNGFINLSHFSSLFKKERGMTPSRYRKSYFIVEK